MAMKILITGSSGLIGSEVAMHFGERDNDIHGIDNNLRSKFFGADGDVQDVLLQLQAEDFEFNAHSFDVRDSSKVERLYSEIRPDVTIHCAAQPSHDYAREHKLLDFEVNSLATLHLLQNAHRHCPESPFLFMSTNKVYGDAPNEKRLDELETRYEYADPEDFRGIDEACRIDTSTHSFFGVSKLSADLLVQEFGRCYGMPTVCFRAGCLTGPQHAGAELHGFLSYLVKAAKARRRYSIFGYKGKQVRDNLHTEDVCQAMWSFLQNPKPAAVYNLGGGRENSISVLEAIEGVEQRLNLKMDVEYQENHRMGDHICYISDTKKFQMDYPSWQPRKNLDTILDDLCGLTKVANS